MKKKLIGLFIGIVMLSTVPLAVGQETVEEKIVSTNDVGDYGSVMGVTFMAGYVMNPKTVGLKTNAKAVVLGYYEKGLLQEDMGVALLKNVEFRAGNLLYMSEPNDFGLTLVIGICTGFDVVGM